MGICLNCLNGKRGIGPVPSPPLPDGKEVAFWIVLRTDEYGHVHIQGIFTEEPDAQTACLNDTYSIGPIPVNTILPHSEIGWAGYYCPLLSTNST